MFEMLTAGIETVLFNVSVDLGQAGIVIGNATRGLRPAWTYDLPDDDTAKKEVKTTETKSTETEEKTESAKEETEKKVAETKESSESKEKVSKEKPKQETKKSTKADSEIVNTPTEKAKPVENIDKELENIMKNDENRRKMNQFKGDAMSELSKMFESMDLSPEDKIKFLNSLKSDVDKMASTVKTKK